MLKTRRLPGAQAGAEPADPDQPRHKEGPVFTPALPREGAARVRRGPGKLLGSVDEDYLTVAVTALGHVVDVIVTLMLQFAGIFFPRIAAVFEVAGALELFNGVTGEIVLPFLSVDGSARLDYLLDGAVVLPFLDADGSARQDNYLRGDVALPFVEVSGYINGEKRETDVGKTPSLIAPGDSLRLGGGIFLNFDTITIG